MNKACCVRHSEEMSNIIISSTKTKTVNYDTKYDYTSTFRYGTYCSFLKQPASVVFLLYRCFPLPCSVLTARHITSASRRAVRRGDGADVIRDRVVCSIVKRGYRHIKLAHPTSYMRRQSWTKQVQCNIRDTMGEHNGIFSLNRSSVDFLNTVG